MYSDRESRGNSNKSGRSEYASTFPRVCGFRGDIHLSEKKLHGHPLQFNERVHGSDNVSTLRQRPLERASHGQHGSVNAKDSRHSRHTFETNVDYQDRPRFWNTEHRVRGYDSRRESIVAGGQVRTNDDEDKQIMLDPDLRALNATNRRQENLSSTGPFNDGDWRDTRCNHPGAASNDLSTLQDHGSSRSEASEGVASAPSSHSLRRQSTREDGSHNKGRGHSRPPSPGHRERRNGPSRAESSSSLRQKRHRTDDERSRSRDRDTKRKKKEKGKLKDDSGEKRSILTGKKIKLKVKKDKFDRERDANRKELLQFLNSAYE